MKIFVTGASGFIGSAIVKELLDAGIETMGNALMDADKPIVITGGTLGLPLIDGWITEDSASPNESPRFSESAVISLSEAGVHASIVRLAPSVHGPYEKGFRAGFGLMLIEIAKQKGFVAYVGDGSNRWSAVHLLDAARLFRLALEKSAVGARYNAAGDPGIAMRELALLAGKKLDLPVKSISPEEAKEYYGWMSYFVSFESAVKTDKTREQLEWEPAHIGLLEDLVENYF